MGPDGGDCSFTGTAEFFPTLASCCLSVTSESMCISGRGTVFKPILIFILS